MENRRCSIPVQLEGSGGRLSLEDPMTMTRVCLVAALLAAFTTQFTAQKSEDLVNDGKNTENVLTQSMGYDRKSYSPLAQITRANVKRLVPVWSTSLMNDAGELSAPTIYNGVMYVVNGHWTFALDVATGEQIWRAPVEYERAAARVGQPGVIMPFTHLP